MLRWTLCLSVIACALLLSIPTGPAEGSQLGSARVALHLQDRTAKGICDSPTEGGFAPYDVAPTQYQVAGLTGESYDAYLVVVADDYNLSEMVGIAGVSCGIDYDPVESQGVDVFDWILCSDLEFTNAGPNGDWPAAGGGNRLTYDITLDCPSQTVPGYEAEGYVTIFGAFYVYAYGDDELRLTRNMNLASGPELTVGSCAGAETNLSSTAAGWIAFSSTGLAPGCNPVWGPCDEFAPPPECLVSTDSLDFGSVPMGASVYRTFTITNVGSSTLLGTVSSGCGDFLVTGNAGPFAIGENQTRTITVRYSPTTETTTECVITLGSNCADVVCTGTGLPEQDPTCSVSVSTLDFGGVAVGDWAEADFTITNIGGGILSGWVDPGCLEFATTAGSLWFDLGHGQSRLVRVRYLPQTEGPISCTLQFGTIACPGVVCTGVGLPGALSECAVSADTLDFGTVQIGQSTERSFTLTNIGTTTLAGMVSRSCDYYGVTQGGGEYVLDPGESRFVNVRFTPLLEATIECPLALFSTCEDVWMTGTGISTSTPICNLSRTALDFGDVAVGSHRDLSFTISNTGGGFLTGAVAPACGEFAVTSGAGNYTLGAGQSETVTVRFTPTALSASACVLDLGSACADMPCSGTGVVMPDCVQSTETLNFGSVNIGEVGDESFTLTNTTATAVTVTISESCNNFSILTGGGEVTLQGGVPHVVQVRFAPVAITTYECTIQIEGACHDVLATGQGQYDGGGGGGTQSSAVVALHSMTHDVKGSDPCLTDPVSAGIPCDDFDVQQPLTYSTDLYLVVARGDVAPGIGALSCGILYNNGDIGGLTMSDGAGIDLYSWTMCASGLQFPSSPTGLPADEWPASGGGIRLTWNTSIECPRTVVGNDGVHAVAGAFYVFAYSPDVFRITANNNLQSGPEFQVGDCGNSITDLPLSAAASVGFGGTMGYNPCGGAVPVRLLSFTADRDAEGAVIRWKTGAATADHLGFEVHRQTDIAGRELISDGLLSGRSDYAFTDPVPPLGETEYWLAERSREGSITWHGPAILPAAAVTGGRLVMTQPPANPFVTFTKFSFRLPEAGEVRVSIYDTMGREVARPFSGTLSPGEQVVSWDGRDDRGRRLSAGAYIYRIDTAQGSLSGKVIRLQ